MVISTGQKMGVGACGVGIIAVIAAGIFAWNRAAPPREDAEEGEATTATAGAAAVAIASRPAGAPLFTLSPSTTVITAPLHEDGTPDYVAAINATFKRDATPENNVLTVWFAVTGTGPSVLSTKTAGALLAALGAKPSDAQWKSFFTYADEHGHSDQGSAAKVDDEQKAEIRPWTEKDLPLLAAFLKEYAGEIDAGKAAWSRPRYWLPAISGDGRSVIGVLLPSLGLARDLAKSLTVRAMQRAAAHDFEGFASDLFAARHMGALVCSGYTVIEHLVGYAIDAEATRALAGAAASGGFSSEECQRLADMLDKLPPLEGLDGSVDMMERWSALDAMLLVATGHAEVLKEMSEQKEFSAMESIDVDAVDWDTVLETFNGVEDQWVAAFRKPLLTDLQKAARAINKGGTAGARRASTSDLSPAEGETRKAYTARVGAFLMKVFGPDLERAEELHREMVMKGAMARMLVAAAQHRAQSGVWPQSIAEFVPSEEKAATIDMYASESTEVVHYVLTADGPAVYSVGRNHVDNGGMGGTGGRDDIAIGAPIPTTDVP